MEDKIKVAIKPLYAKLLPLITYEKPVVPFCVRWGNAYPRSEKVGILFIGKAVFKGECKPDLEVIFEDPEKKIFGGKNQLQWLHEHFDFKRKGNGYNSRSSGFWRVIRNISRSIYPDDWFHNIAWSNIYKVSPAAGGNPDNRLIAQQKELAQEILLKEIEILSPKFIVFLTSKWEKDFVDNYKKGKNSSLVKKLKWDKGKYETEIWKVDDIYIICSHHPQGKAEWPHSKVISNFIKGILENAKMTA